MTQTINGQSGAVERIRGAGLLDLRVPARYGGPGGRCAMCSSQ